MAYILTVNPGAITGEYTSYWPSVFIATALGAVVGTLMMAFFAKMPLVQASGMGLNSLLGGLVATGAAKMYGVVFTFGQAFMMVLISGDGGVSWKFRENFKNFFSGDSSVFGSFLDVFSDGLVPEGGSIFTVIMIIMTMCMIDMFDTMGTIVGCCGGNRVLSDENDKPYNYDKIMVSDAVATCAGAMLGTSAVTTFVESGSGVSADLF